MKQTMVTSLCHDSLFVHPGSICTQRSLITGSSPLVYNPDCTREASKSGKCAHIQRNVLIPHACLCVCKSKDVFGLWLFVSNLCQTISSIFTPQTDACFPVFLRPTLVSIHSSCSQSQTLSASQLVSFSLVPLLSFSHSLPQCGCS